jgi:type IV pilus assembly protein PilW
MVSSRAKHNSGFSLVELMIGLLLGTIVVGGAISIYLASKRSFVESEQVAALSENSRFAAQLFNDSLRHAGFMGTLPASAIQVDANLTAIGADCTGPAAAYDVDNYLFAVYTTSANVFNCIDDARPDTDVLVVKNVFPRPYSDANPDDPNAPANGEIDFPAALNTSTTYVMANSQTARIFDGADTPPSIGKGEEIPDGMAWEYQLAIYYVRNTAIPRLSRKVLKWNGTMEIVTEDLVEGVENIRFMFGNDSVSPFDGVVDKYSNAGNVADWSRVLSIEVFILLRSATQDMQYADANNYKLGDITVTAAADETHYRRLVTHSSVSLRNPKLVMRGGS